MFHLSSAYYSLLIIYYTYLRLLFFRALYNFTRYVENMQKACEECFMFPGFNYICIGSYGN